MAKAIKLNITQFAIGLNLVNSAWLHFLPLPIGHKHVTYEEIIFFEESKEKIIKCIHDDFQFSSPMRENIK